MTNSHIRKNLIQRLSKSAIVGAIATLSDIGLLALLIEVLGWTAAWANVPALVFGLLVQFAGNKYWAFEDRSRKLALQGALFASVEVVAFALSAGAFHILAVLLGLSWLVSRAVASSAVYFGFSYPIWGKIFHSTKQPQ